MGSDCDCHFDESILIHLVEPVNLCIGKLEEGRLTDALVRVHPQNRCKVCQSNRAILHRPHHWLLHLYENPLRVQQLLTLPMLLHQSDCRKQRVCLNLQQVLPYELVTYIDELLPILLLIFQVTVAHVEQQKQQNIVYLYCPKSPVL